MTDKVFIDTNILVYAYLDADKMESHSKHLKAVECVLLYDAHINPILTGAMRCGL